MEHLIPDIWFQSIDATFFLFVLVAISILALGKGADLIVEAAVAIATRSGISKLIVGATIVSLGTTAPEVAVSVMAAWGGNAGIALGNGIGSIICDTALVFGFCCVISVLPADKRILNRQGWIQFGAGLMLTLVCLFSWWTNTAEPKISSTFGYFFIFLLVIYIVLSISWSKKLGLAAGEEVEVSKEGKLLWDLSQMILGLIIVLISSRILIASVLEIAARFEVSQDIIAATVVAFGTSLPELVTSITAIRKGHKELLIGNIIGADILNVLLVIGASAVAAPLDILPNFFTLHLPVMMLVLVMFRVMIAVSKDHFSRWMGWPLLATYIGYVLLQIGTK